MRGASNRRLMMDFYFQISLFFHWTMYQVETELTHVTRVTQAKNKHLLAIEILMSCMMVV
jgi:hypothetical protein